MLARGMASEYPPDGVLSGCALSSRLAPCSRLRHCAAILRAVGSIATRIKKTPTTIAATFPAPANVDEGGERGGSGGAAGGIAGGSGGDGGDGTSPHRHQKCSEQVAVLVASTLKYSGSRLAWYAKQLGGVLWRAAGSTPFRIVKGTPTACAARLHAAGVVIGHMPAWTHEPEASSAKPPGARGGDGGLGGCGGLGGSSGDMGGGGGSWGMP